MAQDGVFKSDLATDDIASLYSEFLDGYGTQGDGFEQDDLQSPVTQVYSESPVIYGNGPVEFSTSVALVPTYPPAHVWDVEGYYAALGVSHRATRTELRRAFLLRRGHDDDRLTYILKTLLRPALRREYDLLPLGSRWIEDPWVQADIKRKAHLEAQRRTLAGLSTTGERVLQEWGFVVIDEDIEESSPDPLTAEELRDLNGVSNADWCYSFILWRSLNIEAPMQQWQEMLVAEAARQGLATRLVVGVVGGAEKGFVIENIFGHQVVLLGDGELPSPDLSKAAITQLREGTPNVK